MDRTFLVAQRLKRLPPNAGDQVRSLGWKDPLEKEIVTHSSILAWRIPWTKKPGRLQSMWSQRVGHNWVTSLSLSRSEYCSHCSWGSQGKNTEVVCHSLLQWTTFCQTSPPWAARLGWPHMAWLSFMDLDKAVVCVIRLTSFLWLWFVCLPSDASRNTYCLTWVSPTLDEGCLLTTAPPDLECGVVWKGKVIGYWKRNSPGQ